MFAPWKTWTYLWTLGVGARTHGAEVIRLGATDLDAEVPDRNPRWRWRGRYLGAIIHDAEIGATDLSADLSATNSGAELAHAAFAQAATVACRLRLRAAAVIGYREKTAAAAFFSSLKSLECISA